MFLKLQSLLYSLIFLGGLELIVIFHRHVPIILFFLFLIALYQGRLIGGKWKFSVLPALFTLSSAALLYLITIRFEQQFFILLTSSMYYLSLLGAYRISRYNKDQTAKGMLAAASASTIFFTFAGAYGLYLNFLVPLFVLMLVYLFVTLSVSYQYFSLIYEVNDEKKSNQTVWIYSFVLALAMTELAWTINFWPFGYLTTGAVALILYYVLWDIIQSHFLSLLSRKKVVVNLIFFSVLALIVLATSKWIPVI